MFMIDLSARHHSARLSVTRKIYGAEERVGWGDREKGGRMQ